MTPTSSDTDRTPNIFWTDSICGLIVAMIFVYVLKSEKKVVGGDRIQLSFVYLQT